MKIVQDPLTKTMSCVIPFLEAKEGQERIITETSFRFICLSSCEGGMNRRPISLIFTLEQCGKAVGTNVIPVKLCQNPPNALEEEEKLANTKERNSQVNFRKTFIYRIDVGKLIVPMNMILVGIYTSHFGIVIVFLFHRTRTKKALH